MANHLFIPDEWKEWIALNLMLGQPPSDLCRILVEKGFPDDLARLEVRTASTHPYVAAALSLARQRAKRDWLLHTRRVLEAGSTRPTVERLASLSPEAFYSDYYALNRPVILTEILSRWPACHRWNANYLIEQLGDCQVEIQADRDRDPRYERNAEAHRQTVRCADFLRVVFDPSKTNNNLYMTANNSDRNRELLVRLEADMDPLDEYLDPIHHLHRAFLWIGPAGTITPLHHDLTNNFMAQIVGRKRIRLISPWHLPLVYNDYHCFSAIDLDAWDPSTYPDFQQVRVEEVVLEPGELLFLPVGWWHHVTGLDPSVTLTFTNFRQANDFHRFYTTYGAI